MIKNERQYRITKTQAARFEAALKQLRGNSGPEASVANRLLKAQEDALQSQLSDLQKELADYTVLRSGTRPMILTGSFEELPEALIRARIARGLTQQELADRLGLKAQQIQRYEASDYASVSLSRLQCIILALGLTVTESVSLS